MGYWSTHPMGGDAPCDAEIILERNLYKRAGIKPDLDEDGYEEYNVTEEEKLELIEKYKLDIIYDPDYYLVEIHECFKDSYTDYMFAIPYLFIENGIKFDDDKHIERLMYLLGDGGASNRGYTKDEEDSPLKYVKIIKKYKKEIFSKNMTEEEIVKNIADEDKEHILDYGLLTAISKHISNKENGLINVD